jgi:hypothetical protein
MQADHGVEPDDDEEERLAESQARPEQRQLDAVGIVKTIERVQPPRRRDVACGHERNGKPESDLGRLPGGQPPGAPMDQLPEGEADMDGERAIEQHGAGPAAPERPPDRLHLFHRFDRDVAERVIEEVSEREGEEDEARDQAPGLRVAQTRIEHQAGDPVGRGRHTGSLSAQLRD